MEKLITVLLLLVGIGSLNAQEAVAKKTFVWRTGTPTSRNESNINVSPKKQDENLKLDDTIKDALDTIKKITVPIFSAANISQKDTLLNETTPLNKLYWGDNISYHYDNDKTQSQPSTVIDLHRDKNLFRLQKVCKNNIL